MLQTRQEVFRIVPICLKMSQNVQCLTHRCPNEQMKSLDIEKQNTEAKIAGPAIPGGRLPLGTLSVLEGPDCPRNPFCPGDRLSVGPCLF